jgi:hypothetical protein
MVSAVVAASVTGLLVLVLSALAVRWANVRSQRRIEAALRELDEQLRAHSHELQAVVARSRAARASETGELGLILSFDDLLERLAALAAHATGGEAAAVRVRGPGDTLAAAAFGAEDAGTLLEATFYPPGRRPFRVLTVNWTFPAVVERETETFSSALVVPIVEAGVETGTLAVFAMTAAAFRSEHARALEALAEEAAPAIASARRFAEMEAHEVERRSARAAPADVGAGTRVVASPSGDTRR